MRLLNVSLLLVLLILFACKDEKLISKDSLTTKVELLKKNLPEGYEVNVSPFNQLPFQWEGKNPIGFKVVIIESKSKSKKTEVLKPYEQTYSENDKTYKSANQMIRYFYQTLDGGYSFKMMERVHPAKLLFVSSKYVIIEPSNMELEKDYGVGMEVAKAFSDIFLKEKEFKKEVSLSNTDIPPDKGNNLSPTSDLKAVIFKGQNPFHEVFWVRTKD